MSVDVKRLIDQGALQDHGRSPEAQAWYRYILEIEQIRERSERFFNRPDCGIALGDAEDRRKNR